MRVGSLRVRACVRCNALTCGLRTLASPQVEHRRLPVARLPVADLCQLLLHAFARPPACRSCGARRAAITPLARGSTRARASNVAGGAHTSGYPTRHVTVGVALRRMPRAASNWQSVFYFVFDLIFDLN